MYPIVRARAVRRWQRAEHNSWKRTMRDAADPLALDDWLFHRQYRVSKELLCYLCNTLNLKNPQKDTSIPDVLKILATLSFMATGSYQTIVGQDWLLPLSQASISRCIDEVVGALNDLLSQIIKFPNTPEERIKIKMGFYNKHKIPGVIGCIDGTLIAILAPQNSPHEAAFYGRKGYHAINAGIICDSELKILGICAKYGGSAHDSFVWRSWPLSSYIEEVSNRGETGWLLGDSGYPQRPWLMTPILHAANGTPEAYYTEMHVKTRVCVERCIGVLKARWRCLLRHRVLHYEPTKCAKIINACAVLHNLCINDKLARTLEIVPDDVEADQFIGPVSASDMNARQALVNVLWENRHNIDQR